MMMYIMVVAAEKYIRRYCCQHVVDGAASARYVANIRARLRIYNDITLRSGRGQRRARDAGLHGLCR